MAAEAQCMAELLESVGFPYVFYQEAIVGGVRGYFHAFRVEATTRAHLRRSVDNLSLFDLRSEGGRFAIFGTLSLEEAARLSPCATPSNYGATCAAASRSWTLR